MDNISYSIWKLQNRTTEGMKFAGAQYAIRIGLLLDAKH